MGLLGTVRILRCVVRRASALRLANQSWPRRAARLLPRRAIPWRAGAPRHHVATPCVSGTIEAAFRAARLEVPADSAQTIANTYRLKPEVTDSAFGSCLARRLLIKSCTARVRMPAGQTPTRVKAFANGVVAPMGKLIDRQPSGADEWLTYEWNLEGPLRPPRARAGHRRHRRRSHRVRSGHRREHRRPAGSQAAAVPTGGGDRRLPRRADSQAPHARRSLKAAHRLVAHQVERTLQRRSRHDAQRTCHARRVDSSH